MKAWQAIRTGVGASVLAHLLVLALVFFLAEVHPFGAVTAEPIAVDIVTPDEVPANKPDFRIPDPLFSKSSTPGSQAESDKKASPKDSAKEAATQAATPAQQPQQAQPSPKEAPQKEAPQKAASQNQAAQKPAEQKQAALQSAQPDPQQSAQQAAPAQPSPSPAQIAAPIPQAPDLSIKYHVLLGLPQSTPGDGFDAVASTKADVADNVITMFRKHLKSCSKLPSSISPTDQVKIKLRVVMEPDGTLAVDPVLVEASASAKGPALMQSAIQAVEACQPYNMLPADKYAEWKVLDLVFTPQDF